MKSMIVAMALTLSAGSVMAQDMSVFSYRGDVEVDFLSWCDGDKVVAQNQEGKLYVRANCEDKGQTCKVYETRRLSRAMYTANCEAK